MLPPTASFPTANPAPTAAAHPSSHTLPRHGLVTAQRELPCWTARTTLPSSSPPPVPFPPVPFLFFVQPPLVPPLFQLPSTGELAQPAQCATAEAGRASPRGGRAIGRGRE